MTPGAVPCATLPCTVGAPHRDITADRIGVGLGAFCVAWRGFRSRFPGRNTTRKVTLVGVAVFAGSKLLTELGGCFARQNFSVRDEASETYHAFPFDGTRGTARSCPREKVFVLLYPALQRRVDLDCGGVDVLVQNNMLRLSEAVPLPPWFKALLECRPTGDDGFV